MQSERSGKLKKMLSGDMAYWAFEPSPLPPEPPLQIDDEIAVLIGRAHHVLGMLEGASKQIPDIAFFIAMYVRKEALLSSQIEGTQATLDDILDPDIESNTNLEVADVVNYIKAMQFAMERLEKLPLSNRLFKEIHEVLMEGVRGQEKNPGEFRRSQNWIGPQGGGLKDAVYVPPAVPDMEAAMSELERFIHREDDIDSLIKIGLIHYQFETIHPFLDGNGRIGRILITLWLMVKGVISVPVLYISYYMKRNRMEYYDRLNETRRKGHFEEWTKFFLKGIIASGEDALDTIHRIGELSRNNRDLIGHVKGRGDMLIRLFEYIERNPIIEIGKTAEALGVQYNTVSKAVAALVKLSILQQVDSGKRNRRFAYVAYLEVLRKDTNPI